MEGATEETDYLRELFRGGHCGSPRLYRYEALALPSFKPRGLYSDINALRRWEWVSCASFGDMSLRLGRERALF